MAKVRVQVYRWEVIDLPTDDDVNEFETIANATENNTLYDWLKDKLGLNSSKDLIGEVLEVDEDNDLIDMWEFDDEQ